MSPRSPGCCSVVLRQCGGPSSASLLVSLLPSCFLKCAFPVTIKRHGLLFNKPTGMYGPALPVVGVQGLSQGAEPPLLSAAVRVSPRNACQRHPRKPSAFLLIYTSSFPFQISLLSPESSALAVSQIPCTSKSSNSFQRLCHRLLRAGGGAAEIGPCLPRSYKTETENWKLYTPE